MSWEDYVADYSIKKGTAISKAITIKVAIAIKEVIEIVISDQVCDRDQASVGYTTLLTTRRTSVIG